MKKLLYLFVLLLVACSTDPTKEMVVEKSTSVLEEATNVHNAGNDFHKATYSKMDLEIGISKEYLVLVTKENKKYTEFRVIQLKEGDKEKFATLKSGKYEVADFNRELVINNGEEKFYFTILKEPAHQDIFDKNDTYSVIGITKSQADSELAKTEIGEIDFSETVNRMSCRCVWWSAYDQCSSGGEGSFYCSNGGCSVGCNDGYYACCK